MYSFFLKDYFPWTLILTKAVKLAALEAGNFHLASKPVEQKKLFKKKPWEWQWETSISDPN